MSSKYWLLFGSLALGGAQTVACSGEFHSCRDSRTCPAAGAPGMAGEAGADTGGSGGKGGAGAGTHGGGEAGIAEAGSAGLDAQAGEAGTAGTAGDSNVELELEIASPTLATGKTYVPFTGKLSASGAAHYTWSIANGTLPAGLTLQGEQSATVTIAGTPTEAGQFPLSFSVTDGSTTKTVDVTLTVTHSALFLSDRNTTGVNELFVAELGAASAAAPVRLNASLPSGGNITSYAWSPDGSKVLYLATQSSGGAAELWVASLASPGTAQRVSAVGVNVSQTAWLRSGNIAAYATSTGDAYLVDLSGSTPGASKLAVAGSTIATGAEIARLLPSPNGSSIVFAYGVPMGLGTPGYAYVTWATGAPKSTTWNAGVSAFASYSYDGRFATLQTSGLGKLLDFSLASPPLNDLGPNFFGAWSPSSEMLIYNGDLASNDAGSLKLAKFNGGTLTSTLLVQASDCNGLSLAPWSPDGKSVLIGCGRDLQGISDVATATVGAGFSLLPSGFLPNAFSGVPNVDWSRDSKWIALRADRDVDNQLDLYLMRWSAPGVAYKPHANSTASGVITWTFAPNSQSIAFVGTIAPQSNAGLYLTTLPASGAPPIATLVSSPANAVVQTDINWLPGSRVITYRAMVSGAAQLFAVPVAADGTAGSVIAISGASGTGVTSYQLAPTH